MRATMTTLTVRRALLWVLLSLAIVRGAGAFVVEAEGGPFITPFPVPGSPYQVAVEAPDRVWATLPAENAIVRLTLTSPGGYDVASFALPIADSQPYDIAFAAGKVWVTERGGNRIGCFDPDTSGWTEYPVPTANSEPTGIAVVVGDPVEVWFAERAGNKLGRLLVSGAGSATIDEYELPVANSYPESVSALASEPVWFSAPGVSSIYRFRVSYWPWSSDAFAPVPTGSGTQPWDIKVGADGVPWLTLLKNPTPPDYCGDRVGKYTPGTLALFTWQCLPVSDSGPHSLDVTQDVAWFTERNANRVGQWRWSTRTLREYALPGAVPTGIAVDATGCAWVAASGQDSLISWCPPYFHYAYLPLVMKGK